MFDWIESLLQVIVYKILESICQLTWRFDKSGLFLIEIIDNFRSGLVSRGFTTALDQVAASTIGVSRPIFELALVIGLMLIIMSPIARLRWINMRKIILLFFFIPIGLPMLAGAFQDIDSARGEMGATFYANIYSRANFNLVPSDGAGVGVHRDIGEVVSFSSNPQYGGIHAVDVAAAYLFAKRSDVFNTS
ncbi:MAG TPA: hypothetical protein VD886_08255, partial [Herpetosiphonaceae bacterium]|nr:hypothetical protein [Herpetosiphonaceae bacterium]